MKSASSCDAGGIAAWRLLPAAAVLILLLSACAMNVNTVQVDPARLETGKAISGLQCPYGLAGVVDVRPSGDRAGGLGENMLLLNDPSELLANRLLKAGMIKAYAPEVPSVLIEIKRFYLSSNNVAKVPVVVLQAKIDQQEPFLVRAQPVTTNWWGSEDEATSAMAETLQIATNQLITDLNEKCPSRNSK